MKKKMLLVQFGATAWIIVFDFISLLVLPFLDSFDYTIIVSPNAQKCHFIILRETMLFIAVLAITFTLRMKSKLPEFYYCELHNHPELVGLDVDGRN